MDQQEKKQPKTWDEAINELGAFILKSKKEEQMKAREHKEEKEEQA